MLNINETPNLELELKSYDRDKFNKEEWLEIWRTAFPDSMKYLEQHRKFYNTPTNHKKPAVNFLDPDSQTADKIFLFVPKIDDSKDDIDISNEAVDTSDVKFNEKDINEMKEIAKEMNDMENIYLEKKDNQPQL